MTAALLPVFTAILIKILSLYVVMGLGFVYGRTHPKAAEPVSFLQMYFILPIVVGTTIANMEFQTHYLLLPVMTYAACTIVALTAFVFFKHLWKDNTANIFSYACGAGNTGYFGVPVALIVFPPELLGLFIMAGAGITLFQNSLGYYLVARGHFTVRDSLRKLARLPAVYALTIGVVLSATGHHMPDITHDIVRDFRGCYVILGALMIGLGMSRIEKLKLEGGLIATVFAFKFLMWPALALMFIGLDQNVLHLFTPEIYKILMLIAIVPLPADAIPFAIQLKVQPDKASTLVFLSTLFALFYVPLVMAIWG